MLFTKSYRGNVKPLLRWSSTRIFKKKAVPEETDGVLKGSDRALDSSRKATSNINILKVISLLLLEIDYIKWPN